MNKRVLSLFLALMMVLTSFLPQTAVAFAETSTENPLQVLATSEDVTPTSGAGTVVTLTSGAGTVVIPTDPSGEKELEKDLLRVRIEGASETLFDENVEVALDDAITPKDILLTAIGEHKVDATTTNGYFITGLLGESQQDNLGWTYGLLTNQDDFIFPTVGVDKYDALLDNEGNLQVKELIFYITYYNGATLYTKMPIVTIDNTEEVFTVNVRSNEVGTPAIENVTISLSDGRKYQTDVDGNVVFKLNQAADYDIIIEKFLVHEETGQHYPYIVRHAYTVASPGKNDINVNSAIDDLLAIYKDKDSLSCSEVLAYNNLMTDTSEYITTFKKNDSDKHAGLADNIIGCIATQQDASSYLELLVNSQQDDGRFKVDGESTSATNLSNVILALDMANASYDKEKAVQKLLSYESDGYFSDVETTAYVLLALASHHDLNNVQAIIDSSLVYLASEQLDNGGFDAFSYGNSPYSVGPVLQALVRLDQDLTDTKWKKETRSIVEALLDCKVDGKGFEFVEGFGGGYDDTTATTLAFAALSDYASGQSGYDAFTLPPKGDDIESKLKSVISDITVYLHSLETRRDSSWKEHPAFFRPLETMSLNVSSEKIDSDVDAIAEKFVLNTSEGTLPYAMNIIGLKSTGQSTKEFADLLVDNQQVDGSFKVGRVEQTEWSMIALDMANADYNIEKAVQFVIADNGDEESVALLSPALIALSNHKDISGVSNFINEKIDFINTQQLSTGGFETLKGYGEDTQATAFVISALIANGINPLKESKWVKNDKTLFDVLMSYKKLNYFIYNNMYGDMMYKDEATEQVFIAMVDLLNQQSSFSNVQNCKSINSIAKSAYEKTQKYLLSSETRLNDDGSISDMYYSWFDALALNAASDDKKSLYAEIQEKLSVAEGDEAESFAINTISAIASGQILDLSDEKYHEDLIEKQQTNGAFSNDVITQAKAIIALDMMDSIYNRDGAIEILLQSIMNDDADSLEEICWSIIALSRYDEDKCRDALEALLDDLSDYQMNDAGFGDTIKSGLALQAIIAAGEKATADQWKKGSSSLIENIVSQQLNDGTFKLKDATTNVEATGMAFLGLVSQITGKSPYMEVLPELDPNDIYKNNIKDLHKFYDKVSKLNYLQATGLYTTNGVKSDILSKLETRKDEASRTYIVYDNDVEMIAKDIIGLVSLDENPYSYNDMNLVQELLKTLKSDGTFKKDDKSVISSQAYAIIALDMASFDYDKVKSINKLIELYNIKKNDNKLSIFYVSETLIALSKNKDIDNVSAMIETCKSDLKKMQMETGGFDYSDGKSSNASEVSEYDSAAIQAIIAIGDNPESEEYTINGKNPVDGLMAFKRDKHFIYDESKLSYQVYHESSSGYALAALVDLDNKTSMYHKKHELSSSDQAVAELSAYWPTYRKNNHNSAILNIELPEKASEAIEVWKEKLAISWTSGAISTPLIVEDKLYVVCGKTLSVFDKDGTKLDSMTLEGSTSYYANFLASGGGLIYAHIGKGRIQAVDAKTLESKWISTLGDGYDTLSPIVYEDGYVYTGSGPNASNSGSYVGIKVQDLDPSSTTEENAPAWKHESSKGYYWSGGAVIDDVIVFAGDDGELVSSKLKTGQIADTLTLGGQIRNSVVYDKESGKLIIGAKDSKVHSVELNDDFTFDDDTYVSADIPAQSTSPAIVYNDRVYIGSGQMSKGSITVLNLSDLSEIYTADVGAGGIQGGLLATTAYGTDENNHQINIYFTRNNNPGGLYMIKDFADNTTAPEVVDIYIPTDKNYCLSSPISDEDGTIYYSNDSGYLFALKYANVIEATYNEGNKIEEETSFVFPSGEAITFGGITAEKDTMISVKNIEKAVIPQTLGVKQSGVVVDVNIGNATLTSPAKVKLPITNNELADKSSIYYYNESKNTWEFVESTREEDTFVASVNHFSTYGVLADTTGPKNVFIKVTCLDNNSVKLNFTAYDESPITSYKIYRNDFSNVYKSVESPAFTDTELTTGEEYNYKIVAVDHFGNESPLSTIATVIPAKNNSNGDNDNKPNGVPVYMRVVGYDGDIIPRKLIYVDNYNLTPYLSAGTGETAKPSTGWDVDKFPSGATHGHAIESVLRKNSISYKLEDYGDGLYMSMIDGEEQFDILGTSGWMYDVNGRLPNVGCQGKVLNDYDEITWYFSAYGFDGLLPSIKTSKSKIKLDDSIEITLKNLHAESKDESAIAGAIIIINGEETSYKTNDEGKVTLFFDQDGYYNISAIHKKNGLYDMAPPTPIQITAGNPRSSSSSSGGSGSSVKKDTKKPIATQYTEAYATLRKDSTTEVEAIESIDNVRDKVYGAMLRADTDEEAMKLSSDAKDAAELIRWSLDKIETPEAAKDTLGYTNDLMTSVAKSTELLVDSTSDATERKAATESALKATKASTDNALNTINIILKKGNQTETLDDLVDSFAATVLEVKKNITPEAQQQLDALITNSTQEFLNKQTRITTETRDDGYVALFNDISLVDLEVLNTRTIELTKKLLEKTKTTPIKAVVPSIMLSVDTKRQDQVVAYIDKPSLNAAGLSDEASVVVSTPIGSLEIPNEIRTADRGNQIKVSLKRVPRETQSDALKSFIKNDSQVIDVQLSVNKISKTSFDTPVEVSIPYDSSKDTEHKLVVYHEKQDGTFEKLAGVYDPDTQMVTFKTTHLSQFFVKPAKSKFDDVTDASWAKKSIERLSALDIINGKDEYNFMPEEKVTRAEFATMLSRLMNVVPETATGVVSTNSFKDVVDGQWYTATIKKVCEKGWMNGKSEDRFDPNGYITEQEIACVIAKALTEYDYTLSEAIASDSDIPSWAQPSVTLIKQLGLTESLSARGFKPTEKAQRDEVAVLLDELSKILITN